MLHGLAGVVHARLVRELPALAPVPVASGVVALGLRVAFEDDRFARGTAVLYRRRSRRSPSRDRKPHSERKRKQADESHLFSPLTEPFGNIDINAICQISILTERFGHAKATTQRCAIDGTRGYTEPCRAAARCAGRPNRGV